MLNCFIVYSIQVKYWVHDYQEILYPYSKTRGNKDPKNYRPISILSCLGKLFTSILNKRLNAYSDEFLLINGSQIDFRHG